MRSAGATWYGPGLYGNHTACGQTLRPGTIGVAHRTLPCGTTVKFAYHGHTVVTRVIDRGPYTTATPSTSPTAPAEPSTSKAPDRVRYAVAIGSGRRRQQVSASLGRCGG